jgi:DNA/RNA endonuclease YhcR with UshA esterase domain
MARLVRIAAALFLLGALADTAAAQKKITAIEAKEHFGETATVCGDVVSARYANTSKGEPTFLNLDRPYPNQVFTVVIWGNNRSKFGAAPEETLKGKRICVSGRITAYDGVPEIIAEDSQQIKLDSGK